MVNTAMEPRPIRAGVFDSILDADRAVNELLAAGFAKDEITVVCSDEHKGRFFHEFEHQDPAGTSTVEKAVIGGVIGAALGGSGDAGRRRSTGGVGLLVAGAIATWTGGRGRHADRGHDVAGGGRRIGQLLRSSRGLRQNPGRRRRPLPSAPATRQGGTNLGPRRRQAAAFARRLTWAMPLVRVPVAVFARMPEGAVRLSARILTNAATIGSSMSIHPWHDIIVLPDDIADWFPAVIEIPKGSKVKYELDKATGLIRADRILHSAVYYPENCCFVPRTYGRDGDPLDVLVLCQEAAAIPLTIERVRAISLDSHAGRQGERRQGDHCARR